jgi:hypothetical protein
MLRPTPFLQWSNVFLPAFNWPSTQSVPWSNWLWDGGQ